MKPDENGAAESMISKQQHENGENRRKLENRRARALTTMRERMRNFVECPNPENGELDEYTRIMNRSEAAVNAKVKMANFRVFFTQH